jgi:hypothetical protein
MKTVPTLILGGFLLVSGVVCGMLISSSMPYESVDATSTDRAADYLMATGYVDDNLEAVYYLDHLTGRLSAGVLSRQHPDFQALYETNIKVDLASVLQSQTGSSMAMPSKPEFLMVTGENDVRRLAGNRWQASRSALYVAEVNTGMILVYLIPWESELHNANQPSRGKLVLWTARQFTSAVVRE